MINVGPNKVTSTTLQCMLGRSLATLSSQQLEYQEFECLCVTTLCAKCMRMRVCVCVSSLVYSQICPSSIREN